MEIVQYILFGDPSFNAQYAVVPAIIAAIISGASALANVIGQGVSNKKNRENVKESQQFQKDMYAQQLKDSLTYNSPQFKLSQLKHAGINPYLNSAFAGTEYSSSVPSTSTAVNQSPDFSGFGDAANSFFQNKIASKQLELLESQKANLDADTKKKGSEKNKLDEETNTQKILNQYLPQKEQSEIERNLAEIDKLRSDKNVNEERVKEIRQSISESLSRMKVNSATIRQIDAMVAKLNADTEYQKMINDYEKPFRDLGDDPNAGWTTKLANLLIQGFVAGYDKIFKPVNDVMKSLGEETREFINSLLNKYIEGFKKLTGNDYGSTSGGEW